VGRTHLAITVELVHGSHTGDLWPRPGRILIASRSATFEQLATAIDDAFARWDRSHLHEFTLADGTEITPHRWWDGEEPDGPLDGARTRLGRLRLGEQFAYVFDPGDNWQHLCTVGPKLADPVETLGIVRRGRCRAGGGATSPISTAAAGTATTAAPRCRLCRTEQATFRRSCHGGDRSPHVHGRPPRPPARSLRFATAT
jgi:Plasmid pRiA4b ORF-3-like protein